jgi:hypothetical protein
MSSISHDKPVIVRNPGMDGVIIASTYSNLGWLKVKFTNC